MDSVQIKQELLEKNNDTGELQINFNLRLVELLGSHLYTKLANIITEFISNSYDADAENIEILFKQTKDDKTYDISIHDNGIGIAFEYDNQVQGINETFLNIGRKRRVESDDITKKYHRQIQGKKGIGKLAGFGITNEMEIFTTANYIGNRFTLNSKEMGALGNKYRPKHIHKNKQVKIEHGTSIILRDVNINKIVDKAFLDELAVSIAKRFKAFDDNFNCILQLINGSNYKVFLNNELYLDYLKDQKKMQYIWTIPEDINNTDLGLDENIIKFFINNGIFGEIFTTETPLRKEDQGIILYANGKLCQENYSFNERANDNFYTYLTGFLSVDYIDKDVDIDNISTARDSLVWETKVTDELRVNMDVLIKKVQTLWRKNRKEDKKKEINSVLNTEIDDWIKTLTSYEKGSAQKLVDVLINDSNINSSKAGQYIGYIQDMYSFESFKNFAASLLEEENLDYATALELIKKWQLIEAKEMAKVATGRIKTIENFEIMIKNNRSERDVIQPFLEEFPWILDPQINEFKREVTYSSILKERFPDDTLDESNRRIDFLCYKAGGDIIVFELKRPNIKINDKYIRQIYDYQSFLEEKIPNPSIKIKTFLITDNWSCDRTTQKQIDTLLSTNLFEVKSYTNMISDAKQYHYDLIEAYEKIVKLK